MIYTAPRQLLFALILVASFCLHTLILILSTEHQIAESRVQKGERMVTQLINESALALTYSDRVSLSVIANRYTSEYDVTRLVIKDVDEEVLVQTGDAPLQQGTTIEEMATRNDSVIGSVALTMKATSMGEIVTMLWQFILSSFIIHFVIWLIYCQIARPTKEQLESLSREIYEHYFAGTREINARLASQTQEPSIQASEKDTLTAPPPEESTDNGRHITELPSRVTKQQDKVKKDKIGAVSAFSNFVNKSKARLAKRKTDDSHTIDDTDNNQPNTDNSTTNNSTTNAQSTTTDIEQQTTNHLSHTLSQTQNNQNDIHVESVSESENKPSSQSIDDINEHITDVSVADSQPVVSTTLAHNGSARKHKYTPATSEKIEASHTSTIEDKNPEYADTQSEALEKVSSKPHLTDGYDAEKSEEPEKETTKPNKKRSIGNELSAFISGQQSSVKKNLFKIQSNKDDSSTSSPAKQPAEQNSTINKHSPISSMVVTDKGSATATQQQTPSAETVQIKISFVDKFQLLDKLSDAVAEPYFELCTQLLNQAIAELIKLPMVKGVSLANSPVFSYDGAIVELQSNKLVDNEQGTENKEITETNKQDTTDNSNSQHYGHLTLAGVMLGILYKMLNEIVYEKHRELGRFAFTVSIGVSQAGREKAMQKLLTSQAQDHDVMMLLAKPETDYVQQHIRLRRITKPTNVSERECAYVRGMNKQMTERLTKVRNTVLMVEQ